MSVSDCIKIIETQYHNNVSKSNNHNSLILQIQNGIDKNPENHTNYTISGELPVKYILDQNRNITTNQQDCLSSTKFEPKDPNRTQHEIHSDQQPSSIITMTTSSEQPVFSNLTSNSISSSSISTNKSNNGTQNTKKCKVCSDKAVNQNFGVLSCESCKAFFRRNAIRTTPLKCSNSEGCSILPTTRKQCPSCRLKKCRDVGMRSDLIQIRKNNPKLTNTKKKTPTTQQDGSQPKWLSRTYQSNNNNNNNNNHHQTNTHNNNNNNINNNNNNNARTQSTAAIVTNCVTMTTPNHPVTMATLKSNDNLLQQQQQQTNCYRNQQQNYWIKTQQKLLSNNNTTIIPSYQAQPQQQQQQQWTNGTNPNCRVAGVAGGTGAGNGCSNGGVTNQNGQLISTNYAAIGNSLMQTLTAAQSITATAQIIDPLKYDFDISMIKIKTNQASLLQPIAILPTTFQSPSVTLSQPAPMITDGPGPVTNGNPLHTFYSTTPTSKQSAFIKQEPQLQQQQYATQQQQQHVLWNNSANIIQNSTSAVASNNCHRDASTCNSFLSYDSSNDLYTSNSNNNSIYPDLFDTNSSCFNRFEDEEEHWYGNRGDQWGHAPCLCRKNTKMFPMATSGGVMSLSNNALMVDSAPTSPPHTNGASSTCSHNCYTTNLGAGNGTTTSSTVDDELNAFFDEQFPLNLCESTDVLTHTNNSPQNNTLTSYLNDVTSNDITLHSNDMITHTFLENDSFLNRLSDLWLDLLSPSALSPILINDNQTMMFSDVTSNKNWESDFFELSNWILDKLALFLHRVVFLLDHSTGSMHKLKAMIPDLKHAAISTESRVILLPIVLSSLASHSDSLPQQIASSSSPSPTLSSPHTSIHQANSHTINLELLSHNLHKLDPTRFSTLQYLAQYSKSLHNFLQPNPYLLHTLFLFIKLLSSNSSKSTSSSSPILMKQLKQIFLLSASTTNTKMSSMDDKEIIQRQNSLSEFLSWSTAQFDAQLIDYFQSYNSTNDYLIHDYFGPLSNNNQISNNQLTLYDDDDDLDDLSSFII